MIVFFFLDMSKIRDEVIAANDAYVAEFAKTDKGKAPLPPARHFAVLTCMDARLGITQLNLKLLIFNCFN